MLKLLPFRIPYLASRAARTQPFLRITMAAQKRPFNEGKRHFKKSKKQKVAGTEGSNEDVLLADVRALLDALKSPSAEDSEVQLPAEQSEVELTISTLSSTGDGLAEKDGHVYVVPFAAPGDTLAAKVYRNVPEDSYSLADFVNVTKAGAQRTETPQCQYFTQCSGCQFQHLPYSFQLNHKRSIVEKAFRNFSHLPAHLIPSVGETIGSPLKYGYRTKLTPHFDAPPGGRRDKRHGKKVTWPAVPPIGFMLKGSRKTMDIEDCPIGTQAVRNGMARERTRVAGCIDSYQKGATILLRESTQRLTKEEASQIQSSGETKDDVFEDRGPHVHQKSCITDHKATSTEFVDDFRFDNPAGSFFQNNNSILPLVTQYIRDNVLGDGAAESSSDSDLQGAPKIKNMIDAYCGSGFFTVTLSGMFNNSIGIDISSQSINYASKNAELNNLPPNSTHFIAADANALFASVDNAKFPPAETVVIIDPPRKGCDEAFIRQLLAFAPARICYVSCNVHTQARDVGWLVAGLAAEDEGANRCEGLYEIESLRGFDFFPQTSHVEGVAILRKKVAAQAEAALTQPTPATTIVPTS